MDLQKISKNLLKNEWLQLEVELSHFLENPSEEIQDFILENIQQIFFDKNSKISLIYFFSYGKYFASLGKVYIAQKLLEIYFDKIYELKKIQEFQIKFEEVKEMGLVTKKLQQKRDSALQVLGNKESYKFATENQLVLENLHERYWGNERDWLKDQIIISKLENAQELKRSIYYLKKYGREESVIEKIKSTFPEIFKKEKEKNLDDKTNSKYNLNYDDLAIELLKNPVDHKLEETQVINYLKINLESEEEIKEKIVAFKFLGMNRVVSFLAEELIKKEQDEKSLINYECMRIDAELELGNFHKARDLAVEVLNTRSLLKTEEALVWYCLGESYYSLKDFKNAKNCYKKVSKDFPNYRLLKERLKEVEKNK